MKNDEFSFELFNEIPNECQGKDFCKQIVQVIYEVEFDFRDLDTSVMSLQKYSFRDEENRVLRADTWGNIELLREIL